MSVYDTVDITRHSEDLPLIGFSAEADWDTVGSVLSRGKGWGGWFVVVNLRSGHVAGELVSVSSGGDITLRVSPEPNEGSTVTVNGSLVESIIIQ